MLPDRDRDLNHAPDLHLVMDGYRTIAFPLFAADGKIVTQQIRGDSGCHRREGVFIASGPHIRRGQSISGARIVDLAPTILHLMGLPAPDDMDGRVLEEALTGEFRAYTRFEEEILERYHFGDPTTNHYHESYLFGLLEEIQRLIDQPFRVEEFNPKQDEYRLINLRLSGLKPFSVSETRIYGRSSTN